MSGPVPAGHHVGEQLSAYLDGELPEAERAKVEAHVRDCVPCSQWLDELQAVDGCAQEMAVEAPAGYFESFPGRVRARLVARRRPRVPLWTWAAAAAVLLAVITPLTLRERAAAPAREPAAATADRSGDRLQREFETAPAAPAPRATPPPLQEAVVVTAPTTAPDAQAKLRAADTPPPPAAVHQNQARLEEGDAALPSLGYLERSRDEHAASKKETGAETRADGNRPAEGFAQRPRPQDAPGQAAAGAAIPAPPPPAPAAAPAAPATTVPAGVDGAKRGEVGSLGDAKPEPKTKPDTEGGVGLRRKGAVSTVTGAGRADTFEKAQAPSKDFDALAAREAASAKDSRQLYNDWSAFAARHRGTSEGDEARVRALEALAAAWRLGGAPADRTLARALAEAYVKEPGPQKARVRALLDELSR